MRSFDSFDKNAHLGSAGGGGGTATPEIGFFQHQIGFNQNQHDSGLLKDDSGRLMLTLQQLAGSHQIGLTQTHLELR